MTKNQVDLREVKVKEAELEELKRHNLATEAVTEEHYARSDTASLMQAEASQSQAETARQLVPINAMNAVTNRMSVEESMRHNTAVESETYRHNAVSEGLAQREVSEKIRHNVELENQGWSQIAETNRHNLATESVSRTEAAERIRHDYATEQLSQSEISEKIRHNREVESQEWSNIGIQNTLASIRAKEADVKQQEATTRRIATTADIANEAIKRTQDSRRLDIMEQQGAPSINIDNNDTNYAVPNTNNNPINDSHNKKGGGGHFGNSDQDDGPFENIGNTIDDIVDAVNNFLTGGKR